MARRGREKTRMKAPAFWYRSPGVMSKLLAPLESLWLAGAALRRARAGSRYQAKTWVICIGNVVAGGAGKTPTALAIANLLKQAGKDVVFVTRGYGGREYGPLLVDPAKHSVRDVGDEALLLARVAPTWMGRDRVATLRLAELPGTNVILDDGLQDRRLWLDFAFLVIDGATGLGNGHVMPAGPLREPLEDALKRVTAVVLAGAIDVQNIASRIRCPIFHAAIRPDLSDHFPHAQKFFAFAGIGRPEKFYATCREAGLTLTGTKDFPDHHVFTGSDIARLRRQAKSLEARLLTTEKDWVRLPQEFRDEVTVLPIRFEFAEHVAMAQLLIPELLTP